MSVSTLMRRAAVLVTLIGLTLPACAQSAQPKSLVIALDGARADALEIAGTPNLQRLINGTWQPGYQGAYAYQAQTIKDADTMSGPNHTSIYTGVTSAKHGVTANDAAQMSAVNELDYLSALELKNSALNTVKLATWSLDANVPTASDYLKIESDAGSTDRAVKMLGGTYTDANWALGRNVDAMFVFFDDPDHAGHTYGWLSSNYYSALQTADTQIGRILDAVRARPNFANENWQIIVTADHGGYGTSHGPRSAVYFTIPFLVASRTASQGVISGRAHNMDTMATVLSHFGYDPAQSFPRIDGSGNYTLDDTARGASVRPALPASLATGLVANLRFNDTYADNTGRGNSVTIGAGSPAFISGKFGSAVQILPNRKGDKEYLSFGNGKADLDFGGTGASDFTFTLWYRAGTQSGDPVIIGNKNWASGANPGLLWTASVASAGGNELGFNLADTGARRADAYRIDTKDFTTQWWFLAITVDRSNGLSTLYAGSPDGKLYFIANEINSLQDLRSLLPLNIGQDGTGSYGYQLKADVDDLGVWRRALGKDEIRTLFNNGAGREVCSVTGGC
ncbi:alkaline phosphatase family protein [Lysobacter tyrosinilyticus]